VVWRKKVKPGFAESVAIFAVEVVCVCVFLYLNCFSDYVGAVDADVGYDFYFVKVNAVFGNCRMLGYR
jgi:hypothetical protein